MHRAIVTMEQFSLGSTYEMNSFKKQQEVNPYKQGPNNDQSYVTPKFKIP